MSDRTGRVDLRAVALVLTPILVGWLFLSLTDRSGPDDGVYAESPRLTMYKLPRAAEGRDLSFTNIAAATVVPPDPGVRSFFVVGPRGAASPAFAGTADVYLLTSDTGDPNVKPTIVKVPSRVHRVNARTYRILPEPPMGWGEKSLANQQYLETLGTSSSPRSTTTVVVGLVLSDPSRGTQRMYPVRLGPL